MENRNWILGLLLTATVAVVGACGGVDRCEGDVCMQPQDYCQGNTAVQFSGAGTCDADTGGCDYSSVKTMVDCQAEDMECVAGACVAVDRCEGMACDTPDAAYCDGETLVTYDAAGTCADGTCSYAENRYDCTQDDMGCMDGACAAVDCVTGDDCVALDATCEGNVAVSYSGNGTCTESYTCDFTAVKVEDPCDGANEACEGGACRDYSAVATQIDAVKGNLNTADLTLPVEGAVVTLVKPDIAGDAGFFVQAGPTGPALFVKDTGLATLPVEGDNVSFTVTAVDRYAPASATVTDLVISGDTTDVSGWAENVTSATDLVDARGPYENRLLSFTATLVDDLGFGGSGYLGADINTDGISGNGDLEIRVPASFTDTLPLAAGCSVSVSRAVMWAYSARAQLSPFYTDDVTINSCPAPELQNAVATDATTVVLTFSRELDATSVDATDFSIQDLTIDAASAAGSEVVLTTSAQVGSQAYTVSVDGEVLDTLGSAVALPASADFSGFFIPEVYFSEYIEGSSNNKALEIFNAGSTAADLSACVVNLYSNGATDANASFALTGANVAAGDVYVLCNDSIAAEFEAECDVKLPYGGTGVVSFNGDDAVELKCGETTMDVIGQIGTDPGSSWGSAPTVTSNATLRRQCSVTAGDTDGSDAFDPSVEWEGFAQDSFDDLGSYTCN